MKSIWKMTRINGQNCLIPNDDLALEYAQKGQGKECVIDLHLERSAKQFRLYKALLKFMVENTSGFESTKALENLLAVKLGHVETYIDHQGKTGYKVKSFDAETLDAVEFKQYFDAALDIICRDYVPHFPSQFQNEFWSIVS